MEKKENNWPISHIGVDYDIKLANFPRAGNL